LRERVKNSRKQEKLRPREGASAQRKTARGAADEANRDCDTGCAAWLLWSEAEDEKAPEGFDVLEAAPQCRT